MNKKRLLIGATVGALVATMAESTLWRLRVNKNMKKMVEIFEATLDGLDKFYQLEVDETFKQIVEPYED